MVNYEIFNEILLKKITFLSIFIGILIITEIIGVIIGAFSKFDKKYFLVIFIFFIITILIIIFAIGPYLLDINENSYIEYSGEFNVDQIYYAKGGGMRTIITFPDNNNIQFDLNTSQELSEGSHNGVIIYSKHSHVIFEWYDNVNSINE